MDMTTTAANMVMAARRKFNSFSIINLTTVVVINRRVGCGVVREKNLFFPSFVIFYCMYVVLLLLPTFYLSVGIHRAKFHFIIIISAD